MHGNFHFLVTYFLRNVNKCHRVELRGDKFTTK